MSKIKELPELERPREKALRYGIESLTNYELLAIIINSGSPNNSAMDIAYAMLSDNHGLFNLVKKPFSDLTNYKGVNKGKALKISATFEIAKRFNSLQAIDDDVINDPHQVFARYLPKLSFAIQEQVFLIVLDKNKRVLHEVNLYKGTPQGVSFSVTQIIRQIIIHGGVYFYLVHNHPSGDLNPSSDDTFLTTELIRECKKVGILMVDHLIISHNGYFSFKQSRTFLVGGEKKMSELLNSTNVKFS